MTRYRLYARAGALAVTRSQSKCVACAQLLGERHLSECPFKRFT